MPRPSPAWRGQSRPRAGKWPQVDGRPDGVQLRSGTGGSNLAGYTEVTGPENDRSNERSRERWERKLPSAFLSVGRTACELIFDRAHQAPEAVAIAAPGRSPLCFGDLERHMNALAAALNARGVARNSRVAVVLPNGPEMAVAFLAVASCATCAPLNPAYTASEFEFYLDDLQARALIVQAGSDSPARVAARRRRIPIIELILIPNAAAGSFTVSDAGTSCTQATLDLARADDIALVLHTSGTTARPKQVPLTHANLCASAQHIATTLRLSADDRCLNIMPLFHIHGLVAAVLASLAAGGSVACTPGLAGGRFFDWLEALRPTWYTGVPTMHQSILAGANAFRDAIRRNPLRFIRSASAALSPLVMAALERCFNTPVIEAYGMTEAAHQIASNPLPPGLRKPGSVGLAAGPEVATMNDAGELLPCGEQGEIVIRGPNVASGYHANPDANRSAYTNGWFHTGDQGWLDSDRYLFITGRLKEMINRGGEKISPHEIDAVIESHPDVRAAASFGIAHPTLGEEVVAAVVKQGDAAIEASDIIDWVRQRMRPTAVPRRIYFVDQLPHTESGKVRRSELPRLLGLDQPDGTFAGGSRVEEPGAIASPLEAELAGLWASVLQVRSVGPDDDFMLLGGDSLRFASLIASVKSLFGVDLPIEFLFRDAATVASMARVIEDARARGATASLVPPLGPTIRDGPLPLSFGQQRLWFLDRLEEKSTAYHMPMAMRLRGDLKRDALERAINAIVARHESLRTHFVVVEGEPAQVVAQALKIALPVEDLSALEEGAREAAIAAALQREREAPFNLNQGPLLRITLLKLGKREHILLWVCHHIVSDGWSTSVFNRELATLYEAFCEGRDNPLEPLAVQYPDYALWQRRWLQGEALERLLAYWTNKLEGAPPLLALPTDRPRTTERSNRAESRTLDLPEELADSLSAMCRRARVTLFMALLAAFKVLLARYSGQEDIVIGTPIAVRNHVAIEGLIGFFLSTIALRTDLSGNPTFEELLKRVRTTALEAYAHQDLPFEKLIEKINPERNLSHTPVFQVLFNMHNFEEVPPSFAGLEVERLALPDPDAKFDLTLYAMEVGGRLRFRAVYNTDLFDGARIERMLDQWQHLLTQVAENPNRPIHNYSLVTGKTMRLLPNPAIALSEPFGVPVFRQFLAVAQVNAAQSAVRHEGRDWTYQQLEDASKRIAKQLVACGVRSGEVVVVSGQRSFGLVASILGVLGARGIFLLIDPSLPSTRRDLMLQEARGAHWLHVGDGHDEDGNWSAAFRGLLTTRISSGGFCLDPSSEAAMEDVALVDAAPDEAAYIFFTSGTTGKPKAIVGSHKGLSHFIDWERQILGVVHNDRVAQLTGLSFDVVLRDIFLPLTSGATLCLPRPEIVSQGDQLVPWLRREGITILHAVPSLAHAWLDSLPSETHVPTLRWVLFAGEPLTGQLILQWRKQIGGSGWDDQSLWANRDDLGQVLPCPAYEPRRGNPAHWPAASFHAGACAQPRRTALRDRRARRDCDPDALQNPRIPQWL